MRFLVAMLLLTVGLAGCAGGEYVEPGTPAATPPEPAVPAPSEGERDPAPNATAPVNETAPLEDGGEHAEEQPTLAIFSPGGIAGEPFNVTIAYFFPGVVPNETLEGGMHLNGVRWNITFTNGAGAVRVEGTAVPATLPIVLGAGTWNATALLNHAETISNASALIGVEPGAPVLIDSIQETGLLFTQPYTEPCSMRAALGSTPGCIVMDIPPHVRGLWVESSFVEDSPLGNAKPWINFFQSCDGAYVPVVAEDRLGGLEASEGAWLHPDAACAVATLANRIGGGDYTITLDMWTAPPA